MFFLLFSQCSADFPSYSFNISVLQPSSFVLLFLVYYLFISCIVCFCPHICCLFAVYYLMFLFIFWVFCWVFVFQLFLFCVFFVCLICVLFSVFFWVVFILIILIIVLFFNSFLDFGVLWGILFHNTRWCFPFHYFLFKFFFGVSTSPGILNHLNLMSSSTSAIWPWEIPALIFSRFKR